MRSSLRTWSLTVALGISCLFQSSGCTDLWTSSLVEDKRNCAIAPAVCGDFEECDYYTETCKPLPPPSCPPIRLESIIPSSGSRVGGSKVTITGSGFQGSMRVEIDGTELTDVVVEASSQLSGTLGASLASCGPSAVTLISSCFERVTQERAFFYSLDPLVFDDQPQVLPSQSGTAVQQLLSDDVNGDGDPDIIGIESSGIRSFLSDGSGSFTTSGAQSLGGSLFQAALADVTGDKELDVVITDQSNPQLWLLKNNGKGVFGAQSVAMPEPLRGVVLTDLTSDKIADALVVGKSGTLYLLTGSSSGLTGPDTLASGLPTDSGFTALADL